MANVFIGTHRDQRRRFLKFQQLGISSFLIWLADDPKEMYPMDCQEDGNQKKQP
jgi:hypothetical protein